MAPHNQLAAFALALTLALSGGCQNSLRNLAKASVGRLDPPDVPAHQASQVVPASSETHAGQTQQPISAPLPPKASPPRSREPLVEPTREEAFALVLADLQEIGRESPAAQQQLLAELGQADPAHWAPMVQRMRSNLALSQQIASRNGPPGARTASTAGPSLKSNHDHPPHEPAYSEARRFDLSTPAAAESPASQQQRWPSRRSNAHPPDIQPRNTDGLERRLLQSTPQPMLPGQPAALTPSLDAQSFQHALQAGGTPSQMPRHSSPSRDDAVALASAAMVFPGVNSNDAPYPVTTAAASMARQPPTPRHASWDASLDAAIDGLSNSLTDHPQSVSEAYDHVRLRLLRMAAGDLDQAATPPPGLTATEQQYWSNQLLAISTLLNHASQPESRRRAAAGGLHLKRATAALEQLGSLTLTNLAFCEEVYGFGAYKPLDTAEFRPGQDVQVYAEVENFKTNTTPRGEHTSLATSYRVLDQHGGRVSGGEAPIVNDYCAQRRRDFHIQYVVTLPKGIYPGRYELALTITDQLGDKIGHGSLDFEIIEDASN